MIRPSSGIVIVCTKLPLIISRISMVSCVNASTYGKAHTENKLYIYHIAIVLKLYQNSISMMLKLEAMNCTQNGRKVWIYCTCILKPKFEKRTEKTRSKGIGTKRHTMVYKTQFTTHTTKDRAPNTHEKSRMHLGSPKGLVASVPQMAEQMAYMDAREITWNGKK